MLQAIVREIELQKDYLGGATLDTIYFGGGTPSLLSEAELNLIFEKLHQLHNIKSDAEITLEANPDDLTKEKLEALKRTPVNRLSIGIQSFVAADLAYMNRAHNVEEAKACIEDAQAIGFENLTIDLIYGSPTMSDQQWQQNLATIFDYKIPHISCYCLTVEPNTALDHFVKAGKAKAVDEDQAARQFEYLMQAMKNEGYEHYEISNFAKPNQYARHNSNYWKGEAYLGVGPSAHSYNGKSRQWNIAHNANYLKALKENTLPNEVEELSPSQQYNEYIMTSLRTMWGCDEIKIKQWGENVYKHFKKIVVPFQQEQKLHYKDGFYFLTNKGKLLADRIAMELFIVEENK